MKYLILFYLAFLCTSVGAQVPIQVEVQPGSSDYDWFNKGWGAQQFGDEPIDPVDLYLGHSELHTLPSETETQENLSSELESLFEYTHDALYMGGNITGGGESVMNLGAYAENSLVATGKGCAVNGSILLDLVGDQMVRADSFTYPKKEKWLRIHFTDDDLLYGAKLNLKQSMPSTLARLESLLSRWEQDSPIFTKLIRQKLSTVPWRVTNLPIKNPLSDNAALNSLIPQGQQVIQACYQAGLYDPQKVRQMFHETAASYRPGYGVMLSNVAWSRMGDDSRVGLIVHELLRAFQYGDLFPFSNAQIRRVVSSFIYESPTAGAHQLDQLILTHWMPSLGSAYVLDESRLKLACGVDEGHERWISLNSQHKAELLNRFQGIARKLPDRSHLNHRENDLDGLTQIRVALIFQKLIDQFGVNEIKSLIEAGKAPPWLHFVNPAALDKTYFEKNLKDYLSLKKQVCVNPEYTSAGMTEMFGGGEVWEELRDEEKFVMATMKQQDFLRMHDNLITTYKLLNPDWNRMDEKSIHPNIYLPVVDHSIDYLNQLIHRYKQNPRELSQIAILVENNFYGSLDRFIQINQRMLYELERTRRPDLGFNQGAYHFSDN